MTHDYPYARVTSSSKQLRRLKSSYCDLEQGRDFAQSQLPIINTRILRLHGLGQNAKFCLNYNPTPSHDGRQAAFPDDWLYLKTLWAAPLRSSGVSACSSIRD